MSRGSGPGRHKLACVGRTYATVIPHREAHERIAADARRNKPEQTAARPSRLAVFGTTRPTEPPPSLNLPILARRRRAKGGPIDCPVQSADQASATHNVAERDGNEIMDDASCRN